MLSLCSSRASMTMTIRISIDRSGNTISLPITRRRRPCFTGGGGDEARSKVGIFVFQLEGVRKTPWL